VSDVNAQKKQIPKVFFIEPAMSIEARHSICDRLSMPESHRHPFGPNNLDNRILIFAHVRL